MKCLSHPSHSETSIARRIGEPLNSFLSIPTSHFLAGRITLHRPDHKIREINITATIGHRKTIIAIFDRFGSLSNPLKKSLPFTSRNFIKAEDNTIPIR
jgi:hypothetical protein